MYRIEFWITLCMDRTYVDFMCAQRGLNVYFMWFWCVHNVNYNAYQLGTNGLITCTPKLKLGKSWTNCELRTNRVQTMNAKCFLNWSFMRTKDVQTCLCVIKVLLWELRSWTFLDVLRWLVCCCYGLWTWTRRSCISTLTRVERYRMWL
jgi:hypothetical protein